MDDDDDDGIEYVGTKHKHDDEIEYVGTNKKVFVVPGDSPTNSRGQASSSKSASQQTADNLRRLLSNHNKEKGQNKRLPSTLPTTSTPPPRKRSAVETTTAKGPQVGAVKRNYQATSSSKSASTPNAQAGSSRPGLPKSTSLPNQPVASSSSRAEGKRKATPSSDVIDLCSDSDDEIRAIVSKRPKKIKLSKSQPDIRKTIVKKEPPPPLVDSDSEYDFAHSALEMRNESNWKQLPNFEVDDMLTSSLEAMTLVPDISSRLPPNRYGTSGPTPIRPRQDQWAGPYFWTSLKMSKKWRPPRTNRVSEAVFRAPKSRWDRELLQAEYGSLALRSYFHKSSGSINRIAQQGKIIAICSAADGGDSDNTLQPLNPHNKANTLMVLRDDEIRTCRQNGHNSLIDDNFEKFFTVNNIAFDPNDTTRMVSCGNDCTVRAWKHLESYEGFETHEEAEADSRDLPDCPPAAVQLTVTHRYSAPVHDIIYQPLGSSQRSLVAVACQDGNIYTYASNCSPGSKRHYKLAPPDSDHSVGAIAWGRGISSSILFASSEPKGDEMSGIHRAVDVNRQQFAYTFSAEEAGDAIAVDDDGGRLALFTRGSVDDNGDEHILRLYDIRRKNGADLVSTINLEKFPVIKRTHPDGEVESVLGEINCAVFSPDGIYLAVARNDNIVDVYDSRFLERGFLHRFKHEDPNFNTPGFYGFGVVEAQWKESFEGRGLGLITGGNDGCVRLWDVNEAGENWGNGRPIAQADLDIGHFSLGDESKGEAPLIVGDFGGGVSVFDRLPRS